MKGLQKWLLIVGASFVVIAVLFSITNLNNLIKPFYDEESIGYVEKEEIIDENINAVYLDIADGNIKVITTLEENVRIKYSENKYTKYNFLTSGNKVTLKSINKVMWFNFNFAYVSDMYVEIYVPEDRLDLVELKTTNGKINFSNVNISDIELRTTNGNIYASNVISDELVLKNTNGKIELFNIKATNVKMNSTNGRLSGDEVNIINKIEGSTTNGGINFSKLDAEYINLRTTNGGIKVNVSGLENEYKKNIKTTNGSVYMDNSKNGDTVTSKNGSRELILKSTNGSIRVEFDD